ncbi:MAG TPA: hypothetical protein VGK48_25645 [Terriglobia bacterium]
MPDSKQPPRKIYFQTYSAFQWTQPKGPFYRGESFTIRVQVDRPAEKTQVVANIVRDQGQKTYPVRLEKGQSFTDVTVEIEDDYKKESGSTKTKSNFKLEQIADAFIPGTDVAFDVDLDPLPVLSFDGDQPGLAKFKDGDKYSFRLREKGTVRVYLSSRPHTKGSTAEISGNAVAKPVPVKFTEARFADVQVAPIKTEKKGELQLSAKSRCAVSDRPKPLAVSVAAEPAVALSPDDDWITPQSLSLRDSVKIKLLLTGARPAQKVKVQLVSYCFSSNPEVEIEPEAWDTGIKEAGPFLLAKSPALFDPTIELTVTGATAQVGRTAKRKFSLGAKRSVYFSSYSVLQYTDPKPPLYRGETFKVRVALDKAVDQAEAVANIVWDDPPGGKKDPVTIEASKALAEVPLVIAEDFKKDSKDKAATFALSLEAATDRIAVLSGVKSAGPGKDGSLKLELAPLPKASFRDLRSTARLSDDQPGLKKFKNVRGFLFVAQTKAKVRIYLSGRPHSKGSTVKLSGTALDKPIPVNFTQAPFTDVEITVTKRGELKLVDESGCLIDPELSPLTIHVEPFYFAEKDWIEDKGKAATFAAGDCVGIQVSRLDSSDGPGEFGSLTCDAFEKAYPIFFESTKTVCKTIFARLKSDSKIPTAPKAFDIMIAPTGSQPSTAKQSINVAKSRTIYLPPSQFGKGAEFAPGQTVSVRVNLSAPAKYKTSFTLASPAFGARTYEGAFKPWSRTTTVKVLIERTFAKEAGHIGISSVDDNPSQPPNLTLDESADFPAALPVTVRPPRVGFKPGRAFTSRVETESGMDAVFGLGSKATLNFILDRPALIAATAVVTCDAFDEPYVLKFEKDSQAAQLEVEFTKGYSDPILLRVSGAGHCRAVEQTDKSSNQLKVRVKPLPAIKFEEKWIEPPETIFVAGDKAKIHVSLTQPAPPWGVSAKLKSSAFGKEYPIAFSPGAAGPVEVQVAFDSPQDGKYQTITLEGVERCATGTEFLRLVQVFTNRPVYFEAAAISPPGPYRKDDAARIYVRLQHRAQAEASVTLKGPFDDVPVKFAAGDIQKEVPVIFTKEAEKEQEIELATPSGCVLGARVKQQIKVFTPLVRFDEPAVEDDAAVVPGDQAYIGLKLNSRSPLDGCSVDVTSDAFEAGKKYKVVFPRGEAAASIPVRIRHDYKADPQNKATIRLEGFHRCAGDASKTASLKIATPPTVRFEKSKMSLVATSEFASEEEIKLYIAPSVAPSSDLEVKVHSAAFATGHVYVAKISQNQYMPVEVTAVLTNGKAENGEVVAQTIEIHPPSGWHADPLDGVLQVKVKPKNGTTTEKCPLEKSAAKAPEAAGPAEGEHKPAADIKDDSCNLHRLLISVKHGNEKKKSEDAAGDDDTPQVIVKRGPKQDGTFEVVLHKDLATDRDKALVCSPTQIPIIQVIAGRESGDSNLPKPDETVHHTVVQVRLDKADHYCEQQFIHSEVGALQHPIIRLRDRVKGALSELEGRIVKLADAAEEAADKAAKPVTAFSGDVSEAAGKLKKKSDDKLSWVSKLTENASAFQQKSLQKVGKSLGLEVDAAEDAPASPKRSPRRPWRKRYDWLPTMGLASLRPGFAKPEGGKAEAEKSDADPPLLEFPVFQAYQVWHEEVATDDGGDSPTDKIASVVPATVTAGPDLDQTKDSTRGLSRVRDLMSALSFIKMAPRQYEIAVQSCGVPATNPADSHVTHTLRAIVEVYPSDEFCLHYEFQPKNYQPVCIGRQGSIINPGQAQATAAAAQETASVAQAVAAASSSGSNEDETSVIELRMLPQPDSSAASSSDSGSSTDEDWSLEVDIKISKPKGKGLLSTTPPPWPRDGIYRGEFVNPAAADSPKKPAPGEAKDISSLVFHPYKAEDATADPLWKQVVDALKAENAYSLPGQETIVQGTINLDALAGGKLTAMQSALDDKLFGPVNDSGIVLTRNGKTGTFYFEIVKSLSASVQTIRQIVAAFEGISANFTQVAGWGFQFEVRFMEGKANVYWGWKEHTDQRVFPWYSVHLDLMLAKISVAFNAGYTANLYLMKFQAVVYFKLSLEANINDQFFERQSPDDKLPAWADTWVSFMGKAESGANMVLVNENVFHVNAAIQTGLEMRTRITMGIEVQFGIEYQLYWLGVTAGATFKLAGFKEKQKTITLVEGSPKDLPYKRGMFPKPASASWWNARREVNMAYSRAVYQEERIANAIEEYRKLQLEMVGASPKTKELPVLPPDDDASEDERKQWQENKVKWDEQWEDCKATFGMEAQTVKTRTLRRSFPLEKRLDEKTGEAEKCLAALLTLGARLKSLKKRILDFGNEVYLAEVKADEGRPAPASMLEKAIALGKEKDLHYSESIRHQPLQDLNDVVEDLRYYAAFRQAVQEKR